MQRRGALDEVAAIALIFSDGIFVDHTNLMGHPVYHRVILELVKDTKSPSEK